MKLKNIFKLFNLSLLLTTMITIQTFATNGYFCPNVASYYKAGMTEQEYCKPYIQKFKDCEQPGICNRKLFTDQRNLITNMCKVEYLQAVEAYKAGKCFEYKIDKFYTGPCGETCHYLVKPARSNGQYNYNKDGELDFGCTGGNYQCRRARREKLKQNPHYTSEYEEFFQKIQNQ